MELEQSLNALIEAIRIDNEENTKVNSAYMLFAEQMNEATDEQAEESLLRLLSAIETLDVLRAQKVALICGSFAERGYPANKATDYMIDYLDRKLDEVLPFYDDFYQMVDDSVPYDDEEGDEKIQEIFDKCCNEKATPIQKQTIDMLEHLYPCAIALFASWKDSFFKAKERLNEKVAIIGEYNTGTYWLGELFKTLFDEPYVIIDIDTKRGFKGKLGGVSTNWQLQHLLMATKLLNDDITMTDEQIECVRGLGKQVFIDTEIVSKWNMYNAFLLEMDGWQNLMATSDSKLLHQYSNAWIWHEGTPAEIPIYKGYRMVLLGKPPYERSMHAQRTFHPLEVSFELEKVLTEDEIDEWLNIK